MKVSITRDSRDTLHVFSYFIISTMFSNVTVESKANNQVGMHIYLESLEMALKSTLSSPTPPTIRLAKKDNNVFLEVQSGNASVSGAGSATSITQDIPVRVLSVANMAELEEPQGNAPDVFINIPAIHILRSMLERLKKLGPILTIGACNAGKLVLKTDSTLATIRLDIRDLHQPRYVDTHQGLDPEQFLEADVDIAAFAKILCADPVKPESIILCMFNEPYPSVQVHCKTREQNSLSFYVPVREVR